MNGIHYFIRNRGQWPDDVEFLSKINGLNAWITKKGVVYDFYDLKSVKPMSEIHLHKKVIPINSSFRSGHIIRMNFFRNNEKTETKIMIDNTEKLDAYFNYFIGSNRSVWNSNVPLYKSVKMELFNKVYIQFYFTAEGFRYDFILEPGAQPENIRLAFEGQNGMCITADGEISLFTTLGEILFKDINAYQVIKNKIIKMRCRFVKYDNEQIGLDAEWKDLKTPLIIDPLLYSTFLGGSSTEGACMLGFDSNVSLDGAGNVIVSGYTRSDDFPTTSGAYDQTWNGEGGLLSGYHGDIFVSKLNSTGSGLIFSTFIGGDLCEAATCAIDNQEDIYLTGWTLSDNFPITTGAFDNTYNGSTGDPNGMDAIIVKLSNDGRNLIYSTYIGGNSLDQGMDIDIDFNGNCYITGVTASENFPATDGAYDESYNGGGSVGGGSYGDVFVTKLNPSGSNLVYSTYIGGSSIDCGNSCTLDPSNNLILTGHTYSNDFPVTPGSYDNTYNGGAVDAFLLKLNASGDNLNFSTYMGGSGNDWSHGLYLESNGDILTGGRTTSSNFPVTSGSYDTNYKSGEDVFITRLNNSGSLILNSTYIGGTQDDQCLSLNVDYNDEIIFTGYTQSPNYPCTSWADDLTYNGGSSDIIISKFSSGLNHLLYSSFLGGTGAETGVGVVLDAAGDAFITGVTGSSDFPITANAYDAVFAGGPSWGEAFISKVEFNSQTAIVALSEYSAGRFNYSLTYGEGLITEWSLATPGGITSAEIASGTSAQTNGWDGVSYTSTTATFTCSGGWSGTGSPIEGFYIYGVPGGMGTWTCHNSNGIIEATLSVEISSITAILNGTSVLICWTTESEIENVGFNIYRSTDMSNHPNRINTSVITGCGNSSSSIEYKYIDDDIEPGRQYYYMIESLDSHGNTTKYETVQALPCGSEKPVDYAFFYNYPNPFNPTTTFTYDVPIETQVELCIYNIIGEKIKSLVHSSKSAGRHVVIWDGLDEENHKVDCGVYIAALITTDYQRSYKITLLK